MVVKKAPLSKIPYNAGYYGPPSGHRYRVRDGDTWFSIAKRDGYDDPWALITFNFKTTDPAEVNWYLEDFVGCNVSKDGKNYSFSDSARPGYIYTKTNIYEKEYIPPNDELARKAVLAGLTSPELWYVQYFMFGYWIGPGVYGRVTECVKNGRLRVRYDATLGNEGAKYFPVASEKAGAQSDTMRIGFTYASTNEQKSLVVHESTHALLDYMRATGMSVAQSEAFAYLSQCVFFEARVKGASRLSDYNGDGMIFDAATPIAERVCKSVIKEGLVYQVKDWEASKLVKAVGASASYKDKKYDVAYDGIRDPYELEG